MKALNVKLLFKLKFIVLWLGYFFLARLLFLCYYFEQAEQLSLPTLIQTFTQGFKLDLSFAAYIAAIPFLILTLSSIINPKIIKVLIKAFSFLLSIPLCFLMLFDLGLYEAWGIRLDASPLIYLNTPLEMLASLTYVELVTGITIWGLLSARLIFVVNKLINNSLKDLKTGALWNIPLLLITTGLLVIVMRGGLQTIPINQSNVYFSNNMFANHAAINYAWNFTHAVANKSYDTENPFIKVDSIEADKVFEKSLLGLKTIDTNGLSSEILNTEKPNIILIIWESLTAKVVEPLGGKQGVTENFNHLSKEGLLFTNFYANGDRSDKGLVAILSGYYPQPHKSIIKTPNKSRTLPILTQKLADLGYKNSFYYGGDLNFGNMNTYLRAGGVKDFVSGDSFENKDWNSKWGAHDHILLQRLSADLTGKQEEPFFKIVFTLSSHEPFEFPGNYKFGENSKTNRFLSSLSYTDSCIGDFIKESKKQSWWENTLIVVMADHGHPKPKHKGAFNSPQKFHIPMLWLGGALKEGGITNNTVCSQKDFAHSLLPLLGGDNSDFKWGHNIFNNTENHFAHYIFNRGFGTINKDGYVVYDYLSDKVIMNEGFDGDKLELLGKTITQKSFQDFIER